ncbi:MAG: phosphatase PAP2 family protein [Planctomycetota bacterium]|nr:phosphatase PAP2 family protein [Planctomycetota bacterium]
MIRSPLIRSGLDPGQPRGRRLWTILGILTLVFVILGSTLSIFPHPDSTTLNSLRGAEQDQNSSGASSTSQLIESDEVLSFDTWMLLIVHSVFGLEPPPREQNSFGWWLFQIRQISKTTTDLARGEVVLGIMLLASLMARFAGLSEISKKKIYAGFLGMLVAGFVTWVIKIGTGRVRPNGLFYQGKINWDPLSLENLHHSFPSGHATAAGALMMVLVIGFPRVRFVWVGFALWICVTRVLTGNHWPTDTAMGLFLGSFCVAILTSWVQSRTTAQIQEPELYQSSRETVLPVE